MRQDLHRLLAEARWLEALAREIVGERGLAQDLVQDVWVATIEGPPREIRDPRSWLATALRNALRRERRSSSARRTREASIARPEAQEQADVVARAEAQRLLVESVLALDEPSRSTVLWHYFDGLSCADIARREQLSDSTVRNRLSRALEILRETLDRSDARGEGLSAIALLIPMPRAVHASSHLVSTSSLAVGGLLMSIAVKVAAAVVASACLAWWLWPASKPIATEMIERDNARTAQEPALAQSGPTPRREALAEPSASSAPQTVVTEPAAPATEPPPLPTDVIEGIVLEDGVPCTRGGTVDWLRGTMGEFPPEPDATRLRTSTLAPDGTFRIADVDWSNSTIRARLGGNITLNAFAYGPPSGPPGAVPHLPGRRIALRFSAASLVGHVWDEEGRPLANVKFELTVQSRGGKKSGPSELNMNTFATTDASGAYTLEHLADGKGMGFLDIEVGAGKIERQFFGLPVEQGHAYTLDFGVPHPWPTWTGALKNRAGSPIRGGSQVILRDFTGMNSYRAIPTDEEGHLRVRIVPGEYHVWVELTGGNDEVPLGSLTADDHDFEHDLTVTGTRVTGHVRFPDGSAVDGPKRRTRVGCSQAGETNPSAARESWVLSDGSFTLDALEPGTYSFTTFPLALAGGQQSVEVIVRAEDLELVRDLVVAAH